MIQLVRYIVPFARFHKSLGKTFRKSLSNLQVEGILSEEEKKKLAQFIDADDPPAALSLSLYIMLSYFPGQITEIQLVLATIIVVLTTFQDDLLDKKRPERFEDRKGIDIMAQFFNFSHRGVEAKEVIGLLMKIVERHDDYKGHADYLKKQWSKFVTEGPDGFYKHDWSVDPGKLYSYEDAQRHRRSTSTPYVIVAYEFIKGYQDFAENKELHEGNVMLLRILTDLLQLYDDWSDVYQDFDKTINLAIGIMNRYRKERGLFEKLVKEGCGDTNNHVWSLQVVDRHLPKTKKDINDEVERLIKKYEAQCEELGVESSQIIQFMNAVSKSTLQLAGLFMFLQRTMKFRFKSTEI